MAHAAWVRRDANWCTLQDNAEATQCEIEQWDESGDYRAPPTRRAWPAVSRKDVAIKTEAERRLSSLFAGDYGVLPISYYGLEGYEVLP